VTLLNVRVEFRFSTAPLVTEQVSGHAFHVPSSLVDSMDSGWETRIGGEHRTEVTKVTEGDGGWMADGSLVNSLASGRERRASGERRTEVTEATEGDRAWMVTVFWWTAWFPGGKEAHRGDHRTEVTEATEGDRAWMAEASLVDSLASERKLGV
jgi:hypothetical protein